NSESADVTVELVDVGRGTDRRDYDGKDVRGKLVLCDAVPSACHRLAVEELGAAGLVSYNSNQVSAWWRDDQDLIRWGHLDARGRKNAFAIMISVREARALQQRLARGERITLHAVVRARNDDAMRAAGDGDMARAIRSRGGSKDAFWADITPYESGSDHWIYQEGAFAIPAIYLRDLPDIYIHTTGDVADNIEPTKIKRSAFIAAASGYYLATMPDHGTSLLRLSYANAYERLAEDGRRAVAMAVDTAGTRSTTERDARNGEAVNIVAQGLLREQRRLRS